MRSTFIILISLLFQCFALTQQQHFTYVDLEINRYYNLKPETVIPIFWESDNEFVYQKDSIIFKCQIDEDKSYMLVSLSGINKQLRALGIECLKRIPRLGLFRENSFWFAHQGHFLLLDFSSGEVTRLFDIEEGFENFEINPLNNIVACTYEGNIVLVDEANVKTAITNDSLPGIDNGASTVHRNEFGIEKGMFWSPDGKYLAYYKRDASFVTDYPLVDITSRIAFAEPVKYPMAGMKSEEVKLCVYNLEDETTIELKTAGDPEQYLTNISWNSDASEVYIQQLNRDQDHMQLISYDIQTGASRDTIHEETSKTYVEPYHPLMFSKINPESFFYQSKISGYNHIYYYNSENDSLIQITEGDWEVTGFYGYGPDEKYIYYASTGESSLQRNIYRMNLETGKEYLLTAIPGTHTALFSPGYVYFIDDFSSASIPHKVQVTSTEGRVKAILLNAEDPLQDYALGEKRMGTIKSADGITDLHYRMILPVDFKEKKRYPVVIYVYGGPHVQILTDSWIDRTEMWQQFLAQKGYISFTIDCRGSEGRGKAFEEVVHRQLGIPQLEDHVEGVKFLHGLDFVDTNRIGVHGWSFGGYMTVSMLTKYPSLFKVGVAGGTVIDWKYYEVMYGERYMDTPQQNPDGYDLTNLNNYAQNLQGDLLLIQGAQDPVVVWQHSLSFIQSCIEANKQVDVFVYPLHEHNVRGKDRVHLIQLISEYFFDHL